MQDGEPLDVRADIYAVGATLYYLLTGRPPLEAPDFRELVSKVCTCQKPPSPRVLRRDIPRGLAAVVLRCLAKAPAGRPQVVRRLTRSFRTVRARARSPCSARDTPHRVDCLVEDDRLGDGLGARLFGVDCRRDTRIATALLRLTAWSWLVQVIYYFALEGSWGASLGKRLMGLRVTSQTPSESNARWWLRVRMRPAVLHVPTVIYFMGAARGTTVHWMRVHGAIAALDHTALPPAAVATDGPASTSC